MDRELISFTYMHTNSTLMLKRAPRIFAIVEPILRREGLPADLKYLMAIESNLEPKALSGAGAAGLWQMMKSTAKEYGLEVSSEVDERYNIEKETVAACKYLKDVPEKFRPVIGHLMTAGIIQGDGSDPNGNGDVINLTHEQVRTLVFVYRGGGFDAKLRAAGLPPAVG